MDLKEIERKWQEKWEKAGIFQAEPDGRPKFYLTVAYPYVSGPMHIGHARTYTIPDVIARYKRMRGYNVLFPMAFHFTGTPIVGASKRVARREPSYVELLTGRYGVPPELLPKMEDPKYFGTYFAEISDLSYKKGMKWLGLSIDWRRDFTTVDPPYNRFVTWQYHKLMEAGFIVKGKHPVRWCPRDGNPVTDHDLLEGEEAEVLEFTLLKYRQGERILPAATLRPETVFGVTNLWLNPKVRYVEVEVEGERWVVSEQAVPKLAEQGYRVGEAKPFLVEFGSEVEVPLTKKKVPLLPADFVDPENATGVVGSVPSHAPYDYVALEELKKRPEELKRLGVEVERLRPLSLIEVEGYGEFPAIEEVKKLGIKEQMNPKLEEATSRVYRAEFAKGKMRSWIPVYGGKAVSEAKNLVKQDLLSTGEAAIMYEFSLKPVRCRCGSPVVMKVVEDQWFLNYADEGWKKKAREILRGMELIPPETRAQYEHTIEWLREWPCTRKVGMGTQAPWDPNWIIESLSDSTLYMAYYTFSHLLKEVNPEKLSDEIFDFVFYGKGDPQTLSRSSGLPAGTIERLRKEFEYWYPLDYRMSASELIPNHLTFFVFHHALLFPHRLPRGIACFGMAVLEGQKMSSSKGNLVEVNKAVKEYGADVVRLYLMSSSEPWQDFNWRKIEVEGMAKALERFHSLCEEILSLPPSGLPTGLPERWLLSRLQRRVEETTSAMERLETRRALQHSFFFLQQDVRKYLSLRGKEARGEVLKKVLHIWLRLLSPFIPHLCEELWGRMNEKTFVSLAPWPEVEEELKDPVAEFTEEFLSSVVEDVGKIVKVVKVKPRLICLYTSSAWKREAYREILKHLSLGRKDRDELLRHLEGTMGKPKAELAPLLSKVLEEARELPEERLALLSRGVDEYELLKENSHHLEKQLGVEMRVFRENDSGIYDPKGRSKGSLPLRPAIYVE